MNTELKPKWWEKNGIIYFSVTSDGATGEEWITRLESRGLKVNYSTRSILRSEYFKPTSGVTTKIAVIKGELFKLTDRSTKKIRSFAVKQRLNSPNIEVVCLIWEILSKKDVEAMGLKSIVVMHKPIKISIGDSVMLGICLTETGLSILTFCDFSSRLRWLPEVGFAFAPSQ